jgi:chromate transporter
MAALVGYKVAGAIGAVFATLAVFLPAGILVYVCGHYWHRFRGNPIRERFARAIAPVVLGLIWAGVLTLAHGTLNSPITIALAIAAAGILLSTKWNQAILVLIAGAIGAVALR